MLTVIFILSCGVMIGVFLHQKKRFITLVEKFTMYAIWLLLFLLGFSIGTNKTVISHLTTLGIDAFFLATSAVLGSLFLSYFLYRYYFKNEK